MFFFVSCGVGLTGLFCDFFLEVGAAVLMFWGCVGDVLMMLWGCFGDALGFFLMFW